MSTLTWPTLLVMASDHQLNGIEASPATVIVRPGRVSVWLGTDTAVPVICSGRAVQITLAAQSSGRLSVLLGVVGHICDR